MWYLVTFILLLVAGAAILSPFFRQQPAVVGGAGIDPRLADLYAQRDMLYQALRDAKFDLETGKLSEEDFARQSTRLKHQAAEVLRRIDQLEQQLIPPALDERIEDLVAERRQQPQALKRSLPRATTPAATAGFCTQCGAPLAANDRFCGKCGQPIRR